MYLFGWKYEGRKISDKLHEQILAIVDIINDSDIVAGKNWPQLQKYISAELGIAPGQVRTIKRMMEEFDIVKKGALNSRDVPQVDYVYTDNGKTLIELMATEKLMRQNPNKDNIGTVKEIKEIYQLYYQKVLLAYCYKENGHVLHPLRATLKALKKYSYLGYWEWYLLNTIIRNDNDISEEMELETCISDYRNGKLRFSNKDIVENQLSHSYVLGNYVYSGLVHVEGSKTNLKVTINPNEKDRVDEILNA